MRRREEEMRRKDENHSIQMDEREKKEADEREERERNMRREMELKRERLVGVDSREEGVSPPPSKRPHSSEEREDRGEQGFTGLTLPQGISLPGTNIKITSRGRSPVPASPTSPDLLLFYSPHSTVIHHMQIPGRINHSATLSTAPCRCSDPSHSVIYGSIS